MGRANESEICMPERVRTVIIVTKEMEFEKIARGCQVADVSYTSFMYFSHWL